MRGEREDVGSREWEINILYTGRRGFTLDFKKRNYLVQVVVVKARPSERLLCNGSDLQENVRILEVCLRIYAK